ncbi:MULTISPECIES: hypothetical protein [unclassified Moraxella]|uniref:hypothetical protein n=1 Tax=unclassified Moraxella TaxID=2685852 RepID=UPI002B404E83|nr:MULTISPECIES: hypothetical protein [unclassified Moraxella]
MDKKLIKRYGDLVEFFKTQTETAKQLNVKQPSVNAWLTGKAKMGAISAKRAEIATDGKFRAVDLCPQLAEIEKQKPPSSN